MIAGFVIQGLVPFGYPVGLNPPFGVPSPAVFLVSRAAWGVGSAFVFVGAFSTVTHVTTPANRGRWGTCAAGRASASRRDWCSAGS